MCYLSEEFKSLLCSLSLPPGTAALENSKRREACRKLAYTVSDISIQRRDADEDSGASKVSEGQDGFSTSRVEHPAALSTSCVELCQPPPSASFIVQPSPHSAHGSSVNLLLLQPYSQSGPHHTVLMEAYSFKS